MMKFITVKGNLLGRVITLCLVYAPNTGQRACPNAILPVLTFSSEDLIAEGDLNLTSNPTADRSDSRKEEPNSPGSYLKQNLSQLSLLDSWKNVKPFVRDYLFYSYPYLLFTQIDYISLSACLKDFLTEAKRGELTWSVPIPSMTTLRDLFGCRRHSNWDLNNPLFENLIVLNDVISKNKISFNDDKNGNLHTNTLWKVYKAALRGKLIETFSRIKKGKNTEDKFFLSEIKKLEKLHKKTDARQMLSKPPSLRGQLSVLWPEKIECIVYQFKQKYNGMGNKGHNNLSYRLKQEKEKNTVIGITKHKSEMHCHTSSYTGEVGLPVIPEHLQKEFEEVKSVIQNMLPSKAPGMERFSIELYKSLTYQLSPKHLSNFQDFKTLADMKKEVNIAVILKAKRYKIECTSPMNISLSNTEFKSFAKVLTESFMLKITSIYQMGFNQRRQLLDNIHRLLVVIHSSLSKIRRSDMLLSLDVEKVYEQVKRKFMKGLGLESKRKKWTEILYQSIKAKQRVNNKYSEPLSFCRGLWQSFPLFPTLFVLTKKPFAPKIRKIKQIQDLNAKKSIHKIVFFVDEVLFMITESLKRMAFREVIGFKINYTKLQVMSICLKDQCQTRLQIHFKFKLAKHHIKVCSGQCYFPFNNII
ncbi:unnamed protein product [Eretmochelys imbricata]